MPSPQKTPAPRRACNCETCRPDLYDAAPHATRLNGYQRPKVLVAFSHDCLQLASLAKKSFLRNPEGEDDHPGLTWSLILPPRSSDESGKDTEASTRASPVQDKTAARSDSVFPEAAPSPTKPIAPLPKLCWSQLHAIARWRRWLTSPQALALSRPRKRLETYNPKELLHAPTEIFNQLFFLGQLPLCGPFLDIRWSPRGKARRALSRTDGDCKTTIWINPYHPRHFLSRNGILGTLLHELSHAFLQRYSCFGGVACDQNQLCIELWQENHGATSHGRAWQTLTAAIEDAAPQLLDGWKVQLGRPECAVQEIEQAGFIPSDCDLQRFPSSFQGTLRVLVQSRDDNAVTRAALKRWALQRPRCPRLRRRRHSI